MPDLTVVPAGRTVPAAARPARQWRTGTKQSK
jgi:hypothetical protein